MELWIRSQDKNRLTRVDDLYIVHDDNNFCDYIGNNMVGHLAKYTKQGRALEVLDKIQEKLQNKFLCKPNCLMKRQDIDREENILNMKYNKDFIMQPQAIDIVPINCDNVVYEMPKE